MNATDVGASLRNARKNKGLSLSELANKTKISVSMLQAIEMNDAAKLPADVFARGFVRAYAREVGLDAEQTLERYVAQFSPETDDDEPARHGGGARRPDVAHDAGDAHIAEQRFPIDGRLQTFVGVGVVLMLVSYFVVRGWQTSGDDHGGVAQAASTDVAPAASPGPPPAAQPVAAPAPPTVAGDVLKLDFNPTGPCWVSIATDGSGPVSRLMHAGERTAIEFKNEVTIRVGDAAAFSYTINGAPGRALGQSGQPVTVKITRDNFREFIAQ